MKDHQVSSTSSTRQLSPDLFDFFSQEYKTETRSHVKQLIAELVGIFIEKYHTNPDVSKIKGHLPEGRISKAFFKNYLTLSILKNPMSIVER